MRATVADSPTTNRAFARRDDLLEAVRRQVMALVDDQVAVVGDAVVDDALPDQALDDRDVDRPVGSVRPPPIRPIDFAGMPRKADSRSTHWSSSCRRCTSTSVLTPRCAMSHAATTVLPNAVVAASTPVSCAQHRRRRPPLLRPQLAVERHVRVAGRLQRSSRTVGANAEVGQQPADVVETAARQRRCAARGPRRTR